ncbi:hypothetical protein Tco_0726437 [Tanacetum coccineum]|uniref:Uncharacterized protein n=1 Tax=Tanacetum coccineum TaxID=301880 RepID=A0ABQ4YGP2_9ASTR
MGGPKVSRDRIKELCVVFGFTCGGVMKNLESLIGAVKDDRDGEGDDVLRVQLNRGKIRGSMYVCIIKSGDLWLWWVGLVVETVLGSDGGGKLGGSDGRGRWT